MKTYRSIETVYELIDLASEIILNTKQQLAYYKVSVYKNEEASKINDTVEDLRQIVEAIQDDRMQEAFRDYDAMREHYEMNQSGDSCFYIRTLKLITTMADILKNYSVSYLGEDLEELNMSQALGYQKRKSSLLARYKRRPRSFFQDI